MARNRVDGTWRDGKASAQVFTLESVYADALERIEGLHISGGLSKEYRAILLSMKNPDGLLMNERPGSGRYDAEGRLEKAVGLTVRRIIRYAEAM